MDTFNLVREVTRTEYLSPGVKVHEVKLKKVVAGSVGNGSAGEQMQSEDFVW